MNLDQKSMEKLFDIVIAFYQERDYFELLNVILTKMMEITNADGGTLYVVEDGMLHFRIMRTVSLNIYQGGKDKIDLPPIKLDEKNINNISAYAAIKNEIVCIDDVYYSDEFNFSGPKNYDQITGYRTCSMLVFPLTAASDDKSDEEVIGVIQLINSIDEKTGQPKPFDDINEDPVFLRAVANISANALANLKYAREIKELFNSFVRVMTKAVDERSPYTVNHTKNVALYCTGFAAWLSANFPRGHKFYLDDNRCEQLSMAALLHDIGKIITPLEVMDKPNRLAEGLEVIRYKFALKKQQLENSYLKQEISLEAYEAGTQELDEALELIKSANTAPFLNDETVARVEKLAELTYIDDTGVETPILTPLNLDELTVRKGTLTQAERLIMQEHVSVTGRLLEQMTFNNYYRDVPALAKSHHEFLDGSGYPMGLSGAQIPLEVCILSISDIFDALVARDRPYKRALPPEKALGILDEMAEMGQLNQELVQLFRDSNVWRAAQ